MGIGPGWQQGRTLGRETRADLTLQSTLAGLSWGYSSSKSWKPDGPLLPRRPCPSMRHRVRKLGSSLSTEMTRSPHTMNGRAVFKTAELPPVDELLAPRIPLFADDADGTNNPTMRGPLLARGPQGAEQLSSSRGVT